MPQNSRTVSGQVIVLSPVRAGQLSARTSYTIANPVAASGPFDPTTASQPLGAFWDIRDATTVQKSNGSGGFVSISGGSGSDGELIIKVLDKSGNGYHAIKPSGANAWVYRWNGGFPYLENPGGAAFEIANPTLWNASGEHTSGAACFFTSSSGGQVYNHDNSVFLLGLNSGVIRLTTFSAGTDTGPTIPVDGTKLRLMETTSTAQIETFVNGVSDGASATTTTIPTAPNNSQGNRFAIGAIPDQFGDFSMVGGWAGGAIFKGVLTPSEIVAYDAYLAAFWTAATTAYSMTAASASFALTGSAMNPAVAMPAASAAFTLSGSAMTPRVAMPAASAAFVLSGTAVALKAGRLLTASSAAFTLTGSAASLRKGFSMAAATTGFVLSGSAVSLRLTRRLVAASAGFVLTGSAAAFQKGYRMAAASVGYALSGRSVAFERGLRFTAGSASYVLTGKAAGLLKGRNMPAASVSYALTGKPIAITAKLQAAAAHYLLAGGIIVRGLSATAGNFTLTGKPAALLAKRKMAAASVAFSFSGGTVQLERSHGFTADAGSFAWFGSPAGIHIAGLLFIPDNAPAFIGLSVPPDVSPAEVTEAPASHAPRVPVAAGASVLPPATFSKEAAPLPPVMWEGS